MEAVILVIHLMLAASIIALVLLQRSEGGGLGIGGGGGLGALASAKTTANVLTRATAVCAAGFFTTSLLLGLLAGTQSQPKNILDELAQPGVETTTAITITEEGKAVVEDVPVPAKAPSAPVSE